MKVCEVLGFTDHKPVIGIIGGMGIQATSCFYEKLHSAQSVVSEQNFFDVLVYSIPSTPDRTAYITGKSKESPAGSLVHAARTLENAGASFIVMPCITSHFFFDDLTDAVSVPVLNLPDVVARCVAGRGLRRVGLLATDGTLESRIFHNAFERHGIEIITPAAGVQSGVMGVIYGVKQGAAVGADVVREVVAELCDTVNGVDLVVLGCTELCIFDDIPNTVNVLDVLVSAVLEHTEHH